MKKDNLYKQIIDADNGNQKLFHKLIGRLLHHDGELVANGETGLTTQLINPSYDTQYSKMVD